MRERAIKMTNFYQVTHQSCNCGTCCPEYRLYLNVEEFSDRGVVSWSNFGNLLNVLQPILSLDGGSVRLVAHNLSAVEKGILEELAHAHNSNVKSRKSL